MTESGQVSRAGGWCGTTCATRAHDEDETPGNPNPRRKSGEGQRHASVNPKSRDDPKFTIPWASGLPTNDIEAALVTLDAEEVRRTAELVNLRTVRSVLLTRLMEPGGSNLHAADLTEAAKILGESEDWVKHHGNEADEYGAAIRMGGSRISGYDVEGLLRWRRAKTRNASTWRPALLPRRASRRDC